MRRSPFCTSGAVGRSDELVQHFSCVPPHDTEATQEASRPAQCAFKRLASRSSGLGAVKGWCSASSLPSSSFHSNMGKSTTHSSECWPSCRQCEPAQKALALRSGARLRHRGKAVDYSSGQRCSQCMQTGRPTSRGRRPPTAGWAGPPALTGAEGREPKHMPCMVQPPHHGSTLHCTHAYPATAARTWMRPRLRARYCRTRSSALFTLPALPAASSSRSPGWPCSEP